MTTMGDRSRPYSLVPPGGGDRTIPATWPECPAYLSGSQQRRFYAVCQRLDDQGTLETADVSVIEALAIAEDNLEVTTSFTNAGERYATVVKEGRPYQCTTCKGTGIRPLPKGTAAVPDSGQAPSAPAKVGHRPCSICTSDRRAEIDTALKHGESLSAVSKAFDTTREAVARHRRNHLDADPRRGEDEDRVNTPTPGAPQKLQGKCPCEPAHGSKNRRRGLSGGDLAS